MTRPKKPQQRRDPYGVMVRSARNADHPRSFPGPGCSPTGNILLNVQVVIYGNPDALIFTDPHYGRLMADICGECGRVEFRVEDPQELYDDYRNAQTEK